MVGHIKMLIPVDYWTGQKTLELEYPWLTPHAIAHLECIIKPHFSILEFGCGGSTMFFARRCRRVVSFETNTKWFDNVKKALTEKLITNVDITLVQDNSGVRLEEKFDLILIDSEGGLNREEAISASLPFLNDNGYVVVDNYGNFDIEPFFKVGYEAQVFDDLHWCGNGTKVFSKCQ
jgi:hypothetical protein